MKKYPEESIKRLVKETQEDQNIEIMDQEVNKKCKVKRKLCRYHIYEYPCPYEQRCHFIHDPDIKDYIKWVNDKVQNKCKWTVADENIILQAHKYSELQI